MFIRLDNVTLLNLDHVLMVEAHPAKDGLYEVHLATAGRPKVVWLTEETYKHLCRSMAIEGVLARELSSHGGAAS